MLILQQVVAIHSLPAICRFNPIFQRRHLRSLNGAYSYLPNHSDTKTEATIARRLRQNRTELEAIACLNEGGWLSNPCVHILSLESMYGIKPSLCRPNDCHYLQIDSFPRELQRYGPCLQAKKIRFLFSRAF